MTNSEKNSSTQVKMAKAEEKPVYQGAIKCPQSSHQASIILITVILSSSMIAMGLFLEIVGPTLIYLKTRIGVNYEEVSRPLVARSVGFFTGSVVGGFLCDAFPSVANLNFSVCFLLAAVGTCVAPWCRSLELLGFLFFLQGITQGSVATGIGAEVIKIWKDKAGPAFVSQHLAYGIGAVIAPQLTNVFVGPSTNSNMNTTNSSIVEANSSVANEHIEYAYVISGAANALFAILFGLVFIFGRKNSPVQSKPRGGEPKKKWKNLIDFLKLWSPGTCTGGDVRFGTAFFIVLIMLNIHIRGGETIRQFLYTYAVESDHQLSPDDAANINSGFWIAFMVGRVVNTAMAIFIKPHFMFTTVVIANIATSLVLSIWGPSDVIVFWVLSCVYGFFVSMLFPTAVVWANQYVEVTAIAAAVFFVGAASGGMFYQWLIGYCFEYYGPDTMLYIVCGSAVNLGLVYMVLQIAGSKHGNRFENMKSLDQTVLSTRL